MTHQALTAWSKQVRKQASDTRHTCCNTRLVVMLQREVRNGFYDTPKPKMIQPRRPPPYMIYRTMVAIGEHSKALVEHGELHSVSVALAAKVAEMLDTPACNLLAVDAQTIENMGVDGVKNSDKPTQRKQ